MIYDASSFVALRDFGDKYHYIKDQFFWIVLGLLALGIFSFFDYRKLFNLALPILVVGITVLNYGICTGAWSNFLEQEDGLIFIFFCFSLLNLSSLGLPFTWLPGFPVKKKEGFWHF
jgi:hypothetical protein